MVVKIVLLWKYCWSGMRKWFCPINLFWGFYQYSDYFLLRGSVKNWWYHTYMKRTITISLKWLNRFKFLTKKRYHVSASIRKKFTFTIHIYSICIYGWSSSYGCYILIIISWTCVNTQHQVTFTCLTLPLITLNYNLHLNP